MAMNDWRRAYIPGFDLLLHEQPLVMAVHISVSGPCMGPLTVITCCGRRGLPSCCVRACRAAGRASAHTLLAPAAALQVQQAGTAGPQAAFKAPSSEDIAWQVFNNTASGSKNMLLGVVSRCKDRAAALVRAELNEQQHGA